MKFKVGTKWKNTSENDTYFNCILEIIGEHTLNSATYVAFKVLKGNKYFNKDHKDSFSFISGGENYRFGNKLVPFNSNLTYGEVLKRIKENEN